MTTFWQFAGLLSLPSVKRNSCAALGFELIRYITGVVLWPGSSLALEQLVQRRPVPTVSSISGSFNNSSVGCGMGVVVVY